MWKIEGRFLVQEMKKKKKRINQTTPYVVGTARNNTAGRELGSTLNVREEMSITPEW
jgi:hypothetical protein